MDFIALGTGSAFCQENWQSNFLIRRNNKNLLIDCGSDIRFSLKDIGLSYKDIDAVYVSHAHADHIGGLEYLAFTSMFDPTCNKIKLYAEGELMQDLWDKSLRGGLEGIEGQEVVLSDYFDLFPIKKNESFVWEGITLEIIQTVHIAAKYKINSSYGLLFDHPDCNERVFITTDTQYCPETYIKAAYNESTHIFHDCETSPFPSGVHPHYDDLKMLPKETKAKMWLYHYQDNVVLNWEEWNRKAIDDGFIGFLPKGVKLNRDLANPLG